MWLDKIIAIWSPIMRETNELARLNKIWERFNNKEDVIDEILSNKWKYHKDKVKLLLNIISSIKETK